MDPTSLASHKGGGDHPSLAEYGCRLSITKRHSDGTLTKNGELPVGIVCTRQMRSFTIDPELLIPPPQGD